MDGIFWTTATSSSVSYGNVAASVREYILEHFPPGFLTDVHISSEHAFRNLKRMLNPNRNEEMRRRQKPYMVIRPSFPNPGPEMFLYNTPMITNIDNIERGVTKKHLLLIMDDEERGFQLDYMLNRDRVDFDITITVATMSQQIDLYKHLYNELNWTRAIGVYTGLEHMIPRSILRHIATLIGTDIDEPKVGIPTLMHYLNSNSVFPITYKIRNATARDEFFFYQNPMIIYTLDDLQMDEPSRKGMVEDYCNVTFRMTAEFNHPGMFLLIGDPRLRKKLDLRVISEGNSDDEFTPIFSLSNLYGDYSSFLDGFKLYSNAILSPDKEDKTSFSVEISELFVDSPEVQESLRESNFFGGSKEPMIRLLLLRNRDQMEEGKEWRMDWNTMTIHVKELDRQCTYRLLVYVNLLYLNRRTADRYLDESTEKPHI